jgi:hypothetical protein
MKTTPSRCPVCGFLAKSKPGLGAHMVIHRPNASMIRTCPRCGRENSNLLDPCALCRTTHCGACYCGEGEDTSPYGRGWVRDYMGESL